MNHKNSNTKSKCFQFFGGSHEMKPIHICRDGQNLRHGPDIALSALTAPPYFWYNCAKDSAGFLCFLWETTIMAAKVVMGR